ncbi:hypothetical protein [Blastococcus sp. SYSU DS0828]
MNAWLATVTALAAQVVVVLALLSGALVLAVTRSPAPALAITLDHLVAAGLLRLAGEPSWQAIMTAAVVIAIRHLAGYSLRHGAASWRKGPGPRAGRSPLVPRRLQDGVHRALHPAWRR